jgi:hypothetical protein
VVPQATQGLFTFDANGNMTQRVNGQGLVSSLSWDFENRLSSIQVTQVAGPPQPPSGSYSYAFLLPMVSFASVSEQYTYRCDCMSRGEIGVVRMPPRAALGVA